MRVFTSYFDNVGYLTEQGFACVGISRFPPEKFKDNNLYIIAPSVELLAKVKNGEYTKEQYKYAYLSQIRMINVAEICKAIENVAIETGNDDVVLCCYEAPDLFCHRHILAEYLNSFNLFSGNIHEWTAKDKKMNSYELF